MESWEVHLMWLDYNQRSSYIWIFTWTLLEDVRLACVQTPELYFDLHVPVMILIELAKSNAIVISCWREVKDILYVKSTRNHPIDQLLHKTFEWKCKQCFGDQNSIQPKTTGNRCTINRLYQLRKIEECIKIFQSIKYSFWMTFYSDFS